MAYNFVENIKTKLCSKCQEDKPLSDFGHRSDKPYLFKSWCNQCCAIRAHRFYHDAPPEKKQDKKIIQARYRESHREQIREYEKKRRLKNPELEAKRSARCKRELREQMITAYGGKCACCGETNYEFLTLEHINGNGSNDRKVSKGTDAILRRLRNQGWPTENYTILCWNCNSSKGVYGYCPHEREVQNV